MCSSDIDTQRGAFWIKCVVNKVDLYLEYRE